MIINKPFPYTSSYKVHIVIGAALGLLLGFILITLKPFNLTDNNLDNYSKILLMGFGFTKFCSYLLTHFIGNYFHTKSNRWTWWNEISFLLISITLEAILAYLYLDLVFEKQPLSFSRLFLFFFHIVIPVTPLLIFPKLVLRYLFSKNMTPISIEDISSNELVKEKTISLKGQNAKDELTLIETQLIYVKSVDNYLLIYYKDKVIKNKMLRASLASLIKQAPFLVQPHRSYLINPKYDFKIKGNSQKATLVSSDFTEQIPIARTSYKKVKSLFN